MARQPFAGDPAPGVREEEGRRVWLLVKRDGRTQGCCRRGHRCPGGAPGVPQRGREVGKRCRPGEPSLPTSPNMMKAGAEVDQTAGRKAQAEEPDGCDGSGGDELPRNHCIDRKARRAAKYRYRPVQARLLRKSQFEVGGVRGAAASRFVTRRSCSERIGRCLTESKARGRVRDARLEEGWCCGWVRRRRCG